MNLLIIFSLFTALFGNKPQTPIDITDIILKSKVIANKTFNEDAMGNKYDIRKPWHIYDQVIDDPNLKQMIDKESDRNLAGKIKMLSLTKSRCSDIALVNDKILMADNPNYLVVMQHPVLNTRTKHFTTVLWIRDKSWSSGFCVELEFKVVQGRSVFIRGQGLTPSDIQEVN